MSFEQATHDEVIKAVETATEDDGVLTEQDRENQEVQKSLKMLTMMYDHENEPGNTEGRNMVLVGITKAAMEYNQDPQEIADLIFGEGVLSMKDFLADAFETTDSFYGLQDCKMLHYEKDGVIINVWTGIQDDGKYHITFGKDGLFHDTAGPSYDSFEDVVEAARKKIWGADKEPITADVRDTTNVDGEPTDGTGVDDLPPSITLDVNPDGSISTLDENGREIELTFDELLARLSNTHDKDWALAQFENIKSANSLRLAEGDIVVQAAKNILENTNIQVSAQDIFTMFKWFDDRGVSYGDMDLDLPQDILSQIARLEFTDSSYRRHNMLYALDQNGKDIYESILTDLGEKYIEAIGQEIEAKTGVLLTNEKVERLVGRNTYNSVQDAVDDTGIDTKFFQDDTMNERGIRLKRGIVTVKKQDIV